MIRVPTFQRGLKWQAKDVVDLLDSIYRGYPIGSLLLWEKNARAAKVELGPLTIDAPETSTAWWVVDGQQRLTTLAASLARPKELTLIADDPYSVYFSPAERRFFSPPRDTQVDEHAVPTSQLLDAARLGEWLYEWPFGKDAQLRRAVLDAGKRIREYLIPLYVVGTDDEAQLREIFYRTNHAGRKLEWEEVHDALFGSNTSEPSTLAQLGESLKDVGMGVVPNKTILTCLIAMRGLDVSRNLADHRRRDSHVLDGAVIEAGPVLRRVMAFLRDRCEIPHLRLLPFTTAMYGLTRMFALHPEPQPRTLDLLVRWVWRGLMSGAFGTDRTLPRRSVSCIDQGDEEKSIQGMLALVPKNSTQDFEIPSNYDARGADTRLALLGLASLKPRELNGGAAIDIAKLIEEMDVGAFQAVFSDTSIKWARSAANRVILRTRTAPVRRMLIDHIVQGGTDSAVLSSHAINPQAARALREGNLEEFLEIRATLIAEAVNHVGSRLARWKHSDRPSLRYLLRSANE